MLFFPLGGGSGVSLTMFFPAKSERPRPVLKKTKVADDPQP